MIDHWDTKRRDWEVSSLAQVGGAALIGGGVLFFCFRNGLDPSGEPVLFTGGGIGLGGSIGGVSLDEVARDLKRRHDLDLSWSSLDVERAFSWADLHNSAGTVTQLGASFVVGVGIMTLTAGNMNGPLFDSVSLGGQAGVALMAGSFAGVWTVLGTARTSRDPAAQSVGRAIENAR